MRVPWFLWSVVYPPGSYYQKDLRAHPIKEFDSEEECRAALLEYQREVDKAYPWQYAGPPPKEANVGRMICYPRGRCELICSPVYPL